MMIACPRKLGWAFFLALLPGLAAGAISRRCSYGVPYHHRH